METQTINWENVKPEDYREVRGKLIYQNGNVKQDNKVWIVGSQTSNKEYKVSFDGHEPFCDCPDCQFRKSKWIFG